MHIHVDKMRGNNAWETVKIKKKKTSLCPFIEIITKSFLHENIYLAKK